MRLCLGRCARRARRRRCARRGALRDTAARRLARCAPTARPLRLSRAAPAPLLWPVPRQQARPRWQWHGTRFCALGTAPRRGTVTAARAVCLMRQMRPCTRRCGSVSPFVDTPLSKALSFCLTDVSLALAAASFDEAACFVAAAEALGAAALRGDASAAQAAPALAAASLATAPSAALAPPSAARLLALVVRPARDSTLHARRLPRFPAYIATGPWDSRCANAALTASNRRRRCARPGHTPAGWPPRARRPRLHRRRRRGAAV